MQVRPFCFFICQILNATKGLQNRKNRPARYCAGGFWWSRGVLSLPRLPRRSQDEAGETGAFRCLADSLPRGPYRLYADDGCTPYEGLQK